MDKYFEFLYDGKIINHIDNTLEVDRDIFVKFVKEEYKDSDAEYWYLEFENNSTGDSKIFSDILDGCFEIKLIEESLRPGHMPTDKNISVASMRGMIPGEIYNIDNVASSKEYEIHENFLSNGTMKAHFENVAYRSSDGICPFFNVHSDGEGAMVAIGWTGGWKADFEKKDDIAIVKTGLKNTHFILKSGEKIRTSSVLVMKYQKGEDYSNKFRKLLKKHFSHKSQNKNLPDGLYAMEMWGGLPSEEMIKRIKELEMHKIGYEQIWIDAGWYGNCTNCTGPYTGGWWQYTGDWSVNKNYHPNGLTDVRDELSKYGKNIMLWIEAERCAEDVINSAEVFKEHPDYLIENIINLGNPNANDYLTKTIGDIIEKLNISCYRQDFNTSLNHIFEGKDDDNRIGITEIKHINGLYKFWDNLHERFPNLLIDNCASGGRRYDIETLKRSIAFFRSDYQCTFTPDANVLQTHNSNSSVYFPYMGCTSKVKSDTYTIRSSYNTSFGIACYNAIFQSLDNDDWKWLESVDKEYRRIRRYFACNFYNIASKVYDTSSWVIWQYHDEEDDSGIIMAFRREDSCFDTAEFEVNAIDKNKKYELELLDDNAIVKMENDNMSIKIPKKRSSTIIIYK